MYLRICEKCCVFAGDVCETCVPILDPSGQTVGAIQVHLASGRKLPQRQLDDLRKSRILMSCDVCENISVRLECTASGCICCRARQLYVLRKSCGLTSFDVHAHVCVQIRCSASECLGCRA